MRASISRVSPPARRGAAFAPGSCQLTLPVYVCAGGVGAANGVDTGCNAANGTLNPNNPFAADGQVARIIGRLPNLRQLNETRSRVYRGALGIKGTVFDNWNYPVDRRRCTTICAAPIGGYIYIQQPARRGCAGHLQFPRSLGELGEDNARLVAGQRELATSDLFQGQFTIGKDLFDLPGGPLQFGVGGAIRYEAIDAPSANPDL